MTSIIYCCVIKFSIFFCFNKRDTHIICNWRQLLVKKPYPVSRNNLLEREIAMAIDLTGAYS
jgi:hypothetical protein